MVGNKKLEEMPSRYFIKMYKGQIFQLEKMERAAPWELTAAGYVARFLS